MNGRARRFSRLLSGAVIALGANIALAQGAATLSGVVRDSVGAPIVDAEVILRQAGLNLRAVRTSERGAFALDSVKPGAYSVWVRRLGYHSADYNWAARFGERVELPVTLHQVARTLDPVVVREREDKLMKGNSSILGLVVDLEGNPIPEAAIDLVGADRSATTLENGGFLVRPLPLGAYVLRVRKLGYAPSTVSVNLQKSDDREVVIRMRRLPGNLDAVRITEGSGYGRDQHIYDALERRLRWHNWQNYVLGPDDLDRYKGLPLDCAAKAIGVEDAELCGSHGANPGARRRGPTSITGRSPIGSATAQRFAVEGDACILLNGKTYVHQPLRTFSPSDLDFLEIYPAGTEVTGTVADKMSGQCASSSLLQHPTYYVLWMKGEK